MVAEERGDAEELFTPTAATPLTGEAVLMACMLQKMIEIKMTKKIGGKTTMPGMFSSGA